MVLFTVLALTFAVSTSLKWEIDEEFMRVTDGACDFPVFDINATGIDLELQLEVPYIVRHAIDGWPAFVKWKKANLLAQYGNRVVRSGSESSIVHSGGVAEHESTLADMVNNMQQIVSNPHDTTFIFDTTILRVIPELNHDFHVPSIFQSWDNKENESTSAMWHMLSLGPSKSGKNNYA